MRAPWSGWLSGERSTLPAHAHPAGRGDHGDMAATTTTPVLGSPAPEVDLPGWVDGAEGRLRLSEQRGAPVVLIHGVGLRGAIWAPQVEALRADHDVIAVDMPGHGGSSPPPADATSGCT